MILNNDLHSVSLTTNYAPLFAIYSKCSLLLGFFFVCSLILPCRFMFITLLNPYAETQVPEVDCGV